MFSDDKIAEIRERADIVEIIGEYVTLKRAGANHKGVCPFHADSDPSFNVNQSRQFFHCFGCGVSGDVFSFVQKIEGLSFYETIKRLAGRYGIDLPEKKMSEAARVQQQKNKDEKSRRLFVLETAAAFFEEHLWGSRGGPGRDLLKERGIGDETSRKFRLGFAPEGWQELLDHLKSGGISASEAEEAGLALPRKSGDGHYDRFRNRLVFTICDSSGNPIAFSARAMPGDDGGAKYINSPETREYTKGKVLYGIHPARVSLSKQKEAILVEGNFDVVAMHEAGFGQTLAPLGTALTAEQALLLRRRVERVIVMFDGDKAGMAAAVRAFPILAKAGLAAYMAPLPMGEDPDSLIRKGGPKKIEQLLENKKGLLDEIISMTAAASDGTVQDVATRVSKLRPLLNSVTDTMTRDIYRQKVAGAFGVDTALVFRYLRDERSTEVQKKSEQVSMPLPGYGAERELIGLLIDLPELCEEATSIGVVSLIRTQEMRKLAETIIHNTHHHSLASAALVNEAHADPVANWLAKRALKKLFENEDLGREALHEIKQNMEKHSIAGQIEEIDKHIQQAHLSGDDMMVLTLSRKKTELQKQIHGVETPLTTTH